jgi:opacity protein-like surface antigen
VSLAAAAMAGFSFAFSPAMAFDVNYRLQYIQGTDVSMPVTVVSGGPYNSKMNTGDLWEHQVRAGIRWNLW